MFENVLLLFLVTFLWFITSFGKTYTNYVSLNGEIVGFLLIIR